MPKVDIPGDEIRGNSINPWQRFLAIPNDRPTKAVGMAALVAFVAALIISSTAQILKPRQLANIESLQQQQLQGMLATLPGLEHILTSSGADSLETRLVDLDSGTFNDSLPIASYDQQVAANDPALSIALDKSDDIAGISRRANAVPFYLLRKDKIIQLIVLPVHGVGYQSTIRAWITLAGDLNTVEAFTVFEQAETPGLGSRIEEPEWQALWNGKNIYDQSGAIALSVSKGPADGINAVDGISGATRTGNGISNLLAFWLGGKGFGPFLYNLRRELL